LILINFSCVGSKSLLKKPLHNENIFVGVSTLWSSADSTTYLCFSDRPAKEIANLEVVIVQDLIIYYIQTEALKTIEDSIYLFWHCEYEGEVSIGRLLKEGKIGSFSGEINDKEIKHIDQKAIEFNNRKFTNINKLDVDHVNWVLSQFLYRISKDKYKIDMSGP